MELLKVIKFEGDDKTLVWKHPAKDFNTQSQLIVHESQEAILYKNGQALDLFGPGRHTLTSQNIPLIKKLINMPTGGVSAFHCEVYFINKSISLNRKWGTSSQIQVLDPTFNIPLNAGASGSMEIQIENSRKFLIKVVGTQPNVDTEKLTWYFREKISTQVKTYLAKIMSEVSYLTINQNLDDISLALHEKLSKDLSFYGVKLVNFYLSTIIIPEADTIRVKEILNKKLEYGTLDYNWADEQIADISKRYASNPGMQDSVGGMVAQIPMALAFGEMLKEGITPKIQNSFSEKATAFKNKDSNMDNQGNDKSNGFCSECGEKLNDNAKFCSKCGNKIKKLKCVNCDAIIKEDDKFCSKCGNKINES